MPPPVCPQAIKPQGLDRKTSLATRCLAPHTPHLLPGPDLAVTSALDGPVAFCSLVGRPWVLFSAFIFQESFPATACSPHCVSVVQSRCRLHVCCQFSGRWSQLGRPLWVGRLLGEKMLRFRAGKRRTGQGRRGLWVHRRAERRLWAVGRVPRAAFGGFVTGGRCCDQSCPSGEDDGI